MIPLIRFTPLYLCSSVPVLFFSTSYRPPPAAGSSGRYDHKPGKAIGRSLTNLFEPSVYLIQQNNYTTLRGTQTPLMNEKRICFSHFSTKSQNSELSTIFRYLQADINAK